MHLHAGQFREDVRHLLQAWPVELHILARREVRITLVEVARDVCELVQLAAGEHAVRNRDAQHRCQPLHIETVAQTQCTEFRLTELTTQETLRLATVLADAFVEHALVVFVVLVHRRRAGTCSV